MATVTTTTLIVGLNPALQQRMVLSSPLVPGEVHRIPSVATTGVGGKGQDAAVALACLGYNKNDHNCVQLMQFLGEGSAGDTLLEVLATYCGVSQSTSTQIGTTSVPSLTIRTDTPLRTCTSLVGPHGVTTELVEPSGAVSDVHIQLLWDAFEAVLTQQVVAAVLFMGSLPPKCPSDIYAQIYRRINDRQLHRSDQHPATLCIIDSVAGLSEFLDTVAAQNCKSNVRGQVLLKINLTELCQWVQYTPHIQSHENDDENSKTVAIVVAALTKFFQLSSSAFTALKAVAITHGPHPAYLALVEPGSDEFHLYRVPVATLPNDRTLYPIGAGDAVAAGTMAAWHGLHTKTSPKQPNDSRSTNLLPPALTTTLLTVQSDYVRAMSVESHHLLRAFSFGLACGSASCLQPENSVLKMEDVITLYQQAGRPVFVSAHGITV